MPFVPVTDEPVARTGRFVPVTDTPDRPLQPDQTVANATEEDADFLNRAPRTPDEAIKQANFALQKAATLKNFQNQNDQIPADFASTLKRYLPEQITSLFGEHPITGPLRATAEELKQGYEAGKGAFVPEDGSFQISPSVSPTLAAATSKPALEAVGGIPSAVGSLLGQFFKPVMEGGLDVKRTVQAASDIVGKASSGQPVNPDDLKNYEALFKHGYSTNFPEAKDEDTESAWTNFRDSMINQAKNDPIGTFFMLTGLAEGGFRGAEAGSKPRITAQETAQLGPGAARALGVIKDVPEEMQPALPEGGAGQVAPEAVAQMNKTLAEGAKGRFVPETPAPEALEPVSKAAETGPERERVRGSLAKEFEQAGVPADQADTALGLLDARARTWSQQTGRPQEEWWRTRLATGEEMPAEKPAGAEAATETTIESPWRDVVRGYEAEELDKQGISKQDIDQRMNELDQKANAWSKSTGLPQDQWFSTRFRTGEEMVPAEGIQGNRGTEQYETTGTNPVADFVEQKGGIRSFKGGYLQEEVNTIPLRYRSRQGLPADEMHQYLIDEGLLSPDSTLDDMFDALRASKSNKISEVEYLKQRQKKLEMGVEPLYQTAEPQPAFFSRLQQAIRELPQDRMTTEQLKAILPKMGVKQDEIAWTGLEDAINGKTSVTKQELLDAVKPVEVKEVLKGDGIDSQELAKKHRELSDALVRAEDKVGEARRKALNALEATGMSHVNRLNLVDAISFDQIFDRDRRSVLMDTAKRRAPEIDWQELTTLHDDYRKIHDELESITRERKTEGAPRFSTYTLPGGQNYRELLLTLPLEAEKTAALRSRFQALDDKARKVELTGGSLTDAEYSEMGNLRDQLQGKSNPHLETEKQFRSSHFSEPNILAHIRFNERTDAEGNKVLFIEEIQSDWHQKGRDQGYIGEQLKPGDEIRYRGGQAWNHGYVVGIKDDGRLEVSPVADGSHHVSVVEKSDVQRAGQFGVPDAPFKKNWHELAFKRALRWAAENGFDKVAWTTGEQQAERYDLSKRLDSITWEQTSDKEPATYTIHGINDGRPIFQKDGIPESKLADYVGKDVAQHIIQGAHDRSKGSIEGENLKVGGEGMKGFYDKMLVDTANKIGKRFGAKTGKTELAKPSDVDEKTGREWVEDPNEPGRMTLGGKVHEGVKVHSLDITPSMRDSVMQGQPLFSGRKASIQFTQFPEGEKAIIRALKKPDVSSMTHEIGHFFLWDLYRTARETGDSLMQKDIDVAEKWAGVEKPGWENWTREQHEKLAKGFEKYVMTGEAPNSSLANIFAKLKEWITQVYARFKGQLPDISPEMKKVFDRLIDTLPDNDLTAEKSLMKDLGAEQNFPDAKESLSAKLLEPEKSPLIKQEFSFTKERPEWVQATVDEVKSVAAKLRALPKNSAATKAILRWDADLQEGSLEALRMFDQLKKAVPDKLAQEGIFNYLDMGGDREALRRAMDATTDKALKKGYEAALNLNPDQVKMAERLKQFFAEKRDLAVKNDVFEEGRENYINRIVKRRGVTEEKPGEPMFNFTGKLVTKPGLAKQRLFDTAFEGEQAGVRYHKGIDAQVAAYSQELNKAIATRRLINNLTKIKAEDGRPLAVPAGALAHLPQEEATGPYLIRQSVKGDFSDYKTVNNPALKKWKWIGADPEGRPLLNYGELKLHPDAYKLLKPALSKSAIREWYNAPHEGFMHYGAKLVKLADEMQSVGKQLMFSLSGFHYVQEGLHAFGHKVNPLWNLPKIDFSNPIHRFLVDSGLKVAGDFNGMQQFREGFGPLGNSPLYKIPGVGPKVLQPMTEYLFREYIPRLKMKTAQAMLERNIKRFSKELESGAVSMSDLGRLSSEQANAAYGHLNYTAIGRDPTVQHALRAIFLAPDFLEARAKFVAQSVKGLFGKAGREQLAALVTLAVAQSASAKIASKVFGGDWHFDKPFSVVIGNREWFMRSVPEDLFRLWTDSARFAKGRVSQGVNLLIELLTKRNYRGEKIGALDALKDYASTYIPISIRNTGTRKDVDWWESSASSMGLFAQRYSPSTKVYDWADKFKQSKGIPEDTGTYPPSKYQDLRFALEDHNVDRAVQEYQKLVQQNGVDKTVRGFHTSLFKPWTTTHQMDFEFRKSLNPLHQQVYDLATEQRAETWKRFEEALKAANQKKQP